MFSAEWQVWREHPRRLTLKRWARSHSALFMPRPLTLYFVLLLLLVMGACMPRPEVSAVPECGSSLDTVAVVERLSRLPPLPTGVLPRLAANRPWAPPNRQEILFFRSRRYIPFGWPLQVSATPGADSSALLVRVAEVQSVPVYMQWEDRQEAAPEWIFLPLSSPCILLGFWVGEQHVVPDTGAVISSNGRVPHESR